MIVTYNTTINYNIHMFVPHPVCCHLFMVGDCVPQWPSLPLRVLSPFRGGRIAYLNDPDSYAGCTCYTPGRATQARQVEG